MKAAELAGDALVGMGIFLAGLGAVMTLEYNAIGSCQVTPSNCAYGEMANYVVWGLVLTAFGLVTIWYSKRIRSFS